jgi:hypothetical protein
VGHGEPFCHDPPRVRRFYSDASHPRLSVIARDIGVKDMGASIPGHGGILDRIDSLIFVAPLFLHMINYFNGI